MECINFDAGNKIAISSFKNISRKYYYYYYYRYDIEIIIVICTMNISARIFVLCRVDEIKLRVRSKALAIRGMSSGIRMNAKLARDVIGQSTLRLKGKPCSGGNGENYINARNRKVYTMIELHDVGLLAEGQSTPRWHFEFFLSDRQTHTAVALFFTSRRNDWIFGGLYLADKTTRAKKKHSKDTMFSAKVYVVVLVALTFGQQKLRTYFSLSRTNTRMREKKNDALFLPVKVLYSH